MSIMEETHQLSSSSTTKTTAAANNKLTTGYAAATTTAPFSKTSLFNRSMTIHASSSPFSKKSYLSSPSISDRNVSQKKWYETAGSSFKGKVKQLRTLFEAQQKSLSNSTSSSSLSSIKEDDCNGLYNSNMNLHNPLARLRPTKSFSTDFKDCWSILDASNIRFPGTEDRVVVYFTSLRGVRRTWEDCHAVRMILRAYKVFVDERDVSMDNAYRIELEDLLKEKSVTLPQVFIKGRYVGGVELIRQLNETGELRKILQVLPPRERWFGCGVCGDVRFLPCSNCSGSRKVYDEDEDVVKRCWECNENGCVRCPECCRNEDHCGRSTMLATSSFMSLLSCCANLLYT